MNPWKKIGLSDYENRVEELYASKAISRTKRNNLLMKESEIPSDFLERDLRDSQYIARKAREILEDLVPQVIPTVGSITDRLREDWQLVDIMQELNWDKYDRLGLTETYQDKDGRTIRRIKEATKGMVGLKIGIMGCIVNGPGEMADADYGYVGAARGRISLYRGKECVMKNIPEEQAVQQLLKLIQDDQRPDI